MRAIGRNRLWISAFFVLWLFVAETPVYLPEGIVMAQELIGPPPVVGSPALSGGCDGRPEARERLCRCHLTRTFLPDRAWPHHGGEVRKGGGPRMPSSSGISCNYQLAFCLTLV